MLLLDLKLHFSHIARRKFIYNAKTNMYSVSHS